MPPLPDRPVARRTHDRPRARFISAAGSAAFAEQWREHRHATLAMRLQQDLRSAAELVARDLRRVGTGPRRQRRAPTLCRISRRRRPPPTPPATPTARRDREPRSRQRRAVRFAPAPRRDRAAARRGGWRALTDAGKSGRHRVSARAAPAAARCWSTAHALPGGRGLRCPRERVRRLALRITARAASDASLVRRIDTWYACATTRSRAPAPPEEPNMAHFTTASTARPRSRSHWPC